MRPSHDSNPIWLLLVRHLTLHAVPVVCVVGPAGYGKPTLLAQWAQRTARRVGWVSVDPRDNDPEVLLTYVAVALDRVEPIVPTVVQALGRAGASIVDAPLSPCLRVTHAG